jgi:hypothetical protein
MYNICLPLIFDGTVCGTRGIFITTVKGFVVPYARSDSSGKVERFLQVDIYTSLGNVPPKTRNNQTATYDTKLPNLPPLQQEYQTLLLLFVLSSWSSMLCHVNPSRLWVVAGAGIGGGSDGFGGSL